MGQILNFEDFRVTAKRALPRIVFDFVEGGCDDDKSIVRNVEAFDRYTLLPRYLVNVLKRSQAVTVLGKRYDAPFGMCPMGHCGFARPGVDLMLAQAAAKANIPYLMSSAANASMEAAAAVAPHNIWFQIYTSSNEDIDNKMIDRAQALSINNLVITADVPTSSNRERNKRNGFGRPPKLSASAALESLRHPGWIARFYGSGGIPPLGNWLQYAPPGPNQQEEAADMFAKFTPNPGMDWERFSRIRDRWQGKLVIKGIMSPADAVKAVEMGADAMVVSNHGGRQLDASPASIDVLPFIKAAVGDRAELILDSGVRRGSSIVKALSLGATTTLFGRPWLYAGASAGPEGIEHLIGIMRREVDLIMGQIGLSTLEEAGPHCVWVPGNPGVAALAAAASVRTPGQPVHLVAETSAA